jgi:hypothetical protein
LYKPTKISILCIGGGGNSTITYSGNYAGAGGCGGGGAYGEYSNVVGTFNVSVGYTMPVATDNGNITAGTSQGSATQANGGGTASVLCGSNRFIYATGGQGGWTHENAMPVSTAGTGTANSLTMGTTIYSVANSNVINGGIGQSTNQVQVGFNISSTTQTPTPAVVAAANQATGTAGALKIGSTMYTTFTTYNSGAFTSTMTNAAYTGTGRFLQTGFGGGGIDSYTSGYSRPGNITTSGDVNTAITYKPPASPAVILNTNSNASGQPYTNAPYSFGLGCGAGSPGGSSLAILSNTLGGAGIVYIFFG